MLLDVDLKFVFVQRKCSCKYCFISCNSVEADGCIDVHFDLAF